MPLWQYSGGMHRMEQKDLNFSVVPKFDLITGTIPDIRHFFFLAS
jgi:hypothetical protein